MTLQITETDLSYDFAAGELRVFYKNRLIVESRRDLPFLTIAEGEGHYKNVRGNYRIRDSRKRRMELDPSEPQPVAGRGLSVDFGGIIECRISVGEDLCQLSFSRLENPRAVGWNRLIVRLPAVPGERIYGGGEQFSYINLRGQHTVNWVQESGVGRGRNAISLFAQLHSGEGGTRQSTYYPLPQFISSENYYVHADSARYSSFDFTGRSCHRLIFWDTDFTLTIGTAKNPRKLIGRLSATSKRQPPLPEWVYDGMILGLQGGRDTVSAKLEKAIGHGIQVSGLWCQDWEGVRFTAFGQQLFWDWKPDEKRYGDLKAFTEELRGREEGPVRFLGYINPFLALEGELYKTAAEKGYCVKNSKGEDYFVTITTFPAALLDLTNPEACLWIKEVIKKNMLGSGLAGWMADFGEYLPTDAVLFSGEDPEEFHNRYPAVWARLNYEALVEAGMEKEALIFMRAGFSGGIEYAMSVWGGDQLVSFNRDDGFPSAIRAGISLGLSGVGNYHTDLGGYTTVAWVKRRKELFFRWAEIAAFMPVMRTHEGNRPLSNWQFDRDEETLNLLARMTKIYAGLKPYHLKLGAEYQEKGMPQIRHLLLHYPADREARRIENQYLYGKDLMVAPILTPKAVQRRVYLPDAVWVHAWTGRRYKQGWRPTEAPLGESPVFYRYDSPFRELFEEIFRPYQRSDKG